MTDRRGPGREEAIKSALWASEVCPKLSSMAWTRLREARRAQST